MVGRGGTGVYGKPTTCLLQTTVRSTVAAPVSVRVARLKPSRIGTRCRFHTLTTSPAGAPDPAALWPTSGD
jgi:hypothetical protein